MNQPAFDEVVDVRLGIGGDFPVPLHAPADGLTTSGYFGAGRDALAEIVRAQPNGIWLVPEFICIDVPATIVACGSQPEAYGLVTPWLPDLGDLEARLAHAVGIVVPFYIGLRPADAIWPTLAHHKLCVIEDRCQCPQGPPSPKELRGDYAIGSLRKWLPLPDGGYCVSRAGDHVRPRRGPRTDMITMRTAAAHLKQCREAVYLKDLDPLLETISLALFLRGQPTTDVELLGSAASRASEDGLRSQDLSVIAASRIRNQRFLAHGLRAKTSVKLFEPEPGAIEASANPLLALPVLCRDRDKVRAALVEHRVFPTILWADGDWSNAGGAVATWAQQILALPIDQRYVPAHMKHILEALD